jgi:uncharacterized protein YuzE
MPNYQVTLPDGTTNTIVADQAFVDEYYPGAELLPEPEPGPAPEPPPPPRLITRLAFRGRFSHAEKVALEIAALDDPAAPMERRQQAAAVRVYMKDVDNATYIDLDLSDTVAGVTALEAGGLLESGRAAEILTAPVTDAEVYRP